ncbi:MAG: hypothetical protein OXG90_07635 [Gammaproteobacteria bacterium]|nr:hypothetical protein [Gammaproteobacteria bacterium]
MSKKSKKQARQGTLALCITAGLVVGVGLGPFVGNMLLSIVIFGLLGIAAGMIFVNKSKL